MRGTVSWPITNQRWLKCHFFLGIPGVSLVVSVVPGGAPSTNDKNTKTNALILIVVGLKWWTPCWPWTRKWRKRKNSTITFSICWATKRSLLTVRHLWHWSVNCHFNLICVCVEIQLKPYRTDEFVHRLFYESSRFSAFNNQWVVKARINDCQKDPTQSSDRDMTYQVLQT